MDFLTHLWLPILASAGAVWIGGFLAWAVIGHHKNDWKEFPNEQEFIETLKRMVVAPGSYGFPEFRKCEGLPKEQKKAKWEEMQKSPMGILRVWGPISMGKNMVLTLVVNLAVSVLVGFLGWSVFGSAGAEAGAASDAAGPGFARVMQVLGTAGVLAYCFGGLTNDIWFQKSRREIVLCFIDGVAFGLITGAVFAWLWPA